MANLRYDTAASTTRRPARPHADRTRATPTEVVVMVVAYLFKYRGEAFERFDRLYNSDLITIAYSVINRIPKLKTELR